MTQLAAIDALFKVCETQRPRDAPRELIDAARAELDTYRRLSRVLHRLNGQKRKA